MRDHARRARRGRRGARRCRQPGARRAATWPRTCTAPAARRPCCASWSAAGHVDGDAPAVQGGTLASATRGARRARTGACWPARRRRSSRAARCSPCAATWRPTAPWSSSPGTERTRQSGPARVFDGEEACTTRRARRRGAAPGDVLVVRYEGPAGGPGMREMLSVTSSVVGRRAGGERRAGHRRALLRARRAGSWSATWRPRRRAAGRSRPCATATWSPSTSTRGRCTFDVADDELARAPRPAGRRPPAARRPACFARYRAAVALGLGGRRAARARPGGVRAGARRRTRPGPRTRRTSPRSPDPRPAPDEVLAAHARGRRLRHRPRDRRRAVRRRPAGARRAGPRPRAARRASSATGTASRAATSSRRRCGARAATARPCAEGVARRLRHRRLRRARHHARCTASRASWWPRPPSQLVAGAARARPPRRARGADLDLRARPAPRARDRRSPAVAPRRALVLGRRRDRHARHLPAAARRARDVDGRALGAAARRRSWSRPLGATLRARPRRRRWPTLRAEIGGFDLVVEAAGDAQLMLDALGLLRRNGVACLLGHRRPRRAGSRSTATCSASTRSSRTASLFGSVNAHRTDWHAAVAALDARAGALAGRARALRRAAGAARPLRRRVRVPRRQGDAADRARGPAAA